MDKQRRSIFAGVVGHALEYYDIMLYGFFAASISPLFFSTDDPVAARLFSLTSFALGFVMRPFGSLFFGHLGDRVGRRKALIFAIFLVSLPTFIIGVVPTYAQIGLAAPVILILCRLLQGFCLGGEVGGAITFVLEHAPKKETGYIGSLIELFCYIGALFGTAIGFLCTQEFMPDWGWRIPFICGGFFGLFGYYIRHKVEETATFEEVKENKQVLNYPVKELLKTQFPSLLIAIGICMGFIVPFYIITTYTNEILKTDLHLTTSEILGLNSGLMILWIALLPLMGKLADRIGIRLLMGAAASFLAVIAYPLFKFSMASPELWKILIMQGVVSVCGIAFSAPFCAVFAYLFPAQQRYSGSGLAYALGAALFGGFAPLMALKLVEVTGDASAPGFLLICSSVVGFLSVVAARKVDAHISSRAFGREDSAA